MYIYIYTHTHTQYGRPQCARCLEFLQFSVYSHFREPGSWRTRKTLLPNLHTLVSSGGTCRRHSSQQASSPLSQPPAREHFFLHTTVESWGPRGKLEIKMIPTRTKHPPWPCVNYPRLTAFKHSLKIPNFNWLQSIFHPLQNTVCWLNIWTMKSVPTFGGFII